MTERSAGSAPGATAHEVRLYLGELRQLFDSLDPSPFRERDLDPKAAEYIVDSAREATAEAPLALVVQLGREAGGEAATALLRDAVHEHFGRCAEGKRRELRELFRTGRISLAIGLGFLAGAIALAQFLSERIASEGYSWMVSESLIIGGWVALWRPLEIFLYDWWPMRAQARLYDRLAAMPVSLRSVAARAEQPA
jgi:hypothetical protein